MFDVLVVTILNYQKEICAMEYDGAGTTEDSLRIVNALIKGIDCEFLPVSIAVKPERIDYLESIKDSYVAIDIGTKRIVRYDAFTSYEGYDEFVDALRVCYGFDESEIPALDEITELTHDLSNFDFDHIDSIQKEVYEVLQKDSQFARYNNTFFYLIG